MLSVVMFVNRKLDMGNRTESFESISPKIDAILITGNGIFFIFLLPNSSEISFAHSDIGTGGLIFFIHRFEPRDV